MIKEITFNIVERIFIMKWGVKKTNYFQENKKKQEIEKKK